MKKRIASALSLTLLIALLISQSVQAKADNKALYESYTVEICNEYGIQPEFVQALIEKESSWNPNANTEYGAYGLCQVVPRYHEERMARLGVTDITEPYSNILVATDYLAELFQEYGDCYEVLMVYNMGDKGEELYEQGIYSNYAEQVTERAAELEREHGK